MNNVPEFDRHRELFESAEFSFTEEQIEKFAILTSHMRSENEKFNLTAIKHTDEIIVKHYIDSLAPLIFNTLPQSSRIIDIGTGAGFPALPLLVAREDIKVDMLDATLKKTEYIKGTAALLRLGSRGTAYNGRAEDFAHDKSFREMYDVAVSRAVSSLRILCEICLPFVRTGGVLIAYKSSGCEAEIEEARPFLKAVGCAVSQCVEYALSEQGIHRQSDIPDDSELIRHSLVIVEKKKPMPKGFPRNYTKIAKCPIV